MQRDAPSFPGAAFNYETENIFLVGDIIDFWAMSRGIYWPELHNTVVQKILKKARHDVRVYLIPGNHDEALREYIGSAFGNINLLREHVHVAADGKRYLLLHGDEYDQVTTYHRWGDPRRRPDQPPNLHVADVIFRVECNNSATQDG